MIRFLKSSTSLTLCMALAIPGFTPNSVIAQSADPAPCGEASEQETFPCAAADGILIETQEDLLQYREDLPESGAETAETDEAPAASPLQDIAEQGQKAVEDAKEVIAAEQAAAEAAQEAADAAAQAEADAAAQAEADAAAQAEADAAAQAEADAAAQAEADATTQAEADAAAQVAAEEAAQAEADAEAQANENAAAQAAADTAADEAAKANAAAQEAAENATDEAAKDELRAERQAARRTERQAEREAARKLLEEGPTGEIITEDVTTDDIRRSDQDFETTATGTPEAKDDDGLSKLEKALIVGLGAVAVGAILKNGDKVLSNSGDRIVVQDESGDLRVLKDDDALLRRPGDEVQTERFSDGSTRQTVQKSDGSKIVTIRGSDGTVLRRISVDANGNEILLFDDLAEEREVVVRDLPQVVEQSVSAQDRSEAELRAALVAQQQADQGRSFSLRQVREISEVRALAPPIELDAARFATGSAAIAPEQARNLARVGNTLRDLIADDPRTVFLIEGHTDAVGDATYNLALSDRRAETVALALTEYFDVPPENMITQGYGESALKIETPLAEQANRRAVVRNITNLLRQTSN